MEKNFINESKNKKLKKYEKDLESIWEGLIKLVFLILSLSK